MKNMHSHERDAKIIHLCAHTKDFSCLFMHCFIILIQINEFIFMGILITFLGNSAVCYQIDKINIKSAA